MSDVKAKLELEPPRFSCGHCRFSTSLTGRWSVEDGRLVFRADADPQPRRGPDLEGCCESRDVAEFTEIVTDTDQVINREELAALRAAASLSRELGES